jgi:hypothetical protein
MKRMPIFSLILALLIICLALWIKHNELKPGIPWKLINKPRDGMVGPVKQVTTIDSYTTDSGYKNRYTEVRTYDRDGRLLSVRYSTPGIPPSESVMVYTGDGHLEYEDTCNGVSKYRENRTAYSYSSARRLGESGNIRADSNDDSSLFGPREHYHRDSLYKFDTAGLLIERIDSHAGDTGPWESQVFFTYDRNGNLTESVESEPSWNLGVRQIKTTYRLDQRGNALETKEVTAGRLLKWTKIGYKFDSRGNWIEKKESSLYFGRKKLHDTELSRRTIVYY